MPALKKRNVILNTECKRVLTTLQTVFTELGLSADQDKSALVDIQVSAALPSGDTFLNDLVRFVEQRTGTALGGHQQELPGCKADMTSASETLFVAYQEYWNNLTRGQQKIQAREIEADDISDPSVLIRELYERLAMQALRSDSQLRSNQPREIFIQILAKLTVKLSKEKLLTNTFHQALFSDHQVWLSDMSVVAKHLDRVNSKKPVLKENLAYLDSLINNIKCRLVLALLDKSTVSGSGWEDKLSAKQIGYTLKEQEDSRLKERKAIEMLEANKKQPQNLLTIANRDMHLQEEKVNALMEAGEGEDDIYRQITLVQACGKDSKIGELYGLLNEAKLFRQFVSLVSDLADSTGWLPFLTGMVNLRVLDDKLNELDASCQYTFKNFQPKDLTTPFGKEFGRATHFHQGRENLASLSTLQHPELLKTVYKSIMSNIESLQKLGAVLYCPVTCPSSSTAQLSPPGFLQIDQRGESANNSHQLPLTSTINTRGMEKVASSDRQDTRSMKNFNALNHSHDSKKFSGRQPTNIVSPRKAVTPPPRPRQSAADRGQPKASSAAATPTLYSSNPGINSFGDPMFAELALGDPSLAFETPGLQYSNHPFNGYEPPENQQNSSTSFARIQTKLQGDPNSSRVNTTIGTNTNKQPASRVTVKSKIPVHPYSPSSADIELEIYPSKVPETETGASVLPLPPPPLMPVKAKKTNQSLYPAGVPYIQRFVAEVRLSKDEVTGGVANFINTDINYFSNPNFSPFRFAVAKAVGKFFLTRLDNAAPKDYIFNADQIKEVWRQRAEEVAILQCLCIGPQDDARLILFINRMKAFTTRFFLFGAEYNELIDDLDQLLTNYYQGRLTALFGPNLDVNTSLLAELATLRAQDQVMSQHNSELTEAVTLLKEQNGRLEKENQRLRSESGGIQSLNAKMEQLQREVYSNQQQHKNEIKDIKTRLGDKESFNPVFPVANNSMDTPSNNPRTQNRNRDNNSSVCTLL